MVDFKICQMMMMTRVEASWVAMIVWYFAVVAEPLREAQDSCQLPTIQPPVTRPWKKGTNTHFFCNISALYVLDHTSLSFVCKFIHNKYIHMYRIWGTVQNQSPYDLSWLSSFPEFSADQTNDEEPSIDSEQHREVHLDHIKNWLKIVKHAGPLLVLMVSPVL